MVVLIDEYDKPILDHIADSATALRFQKVLATFYAVLKSAADRIRFVFSSGVPSSPVSLSSRT